jgi:hypothetical protein
MKLDKFYAHANEALCHSINRKSQQANVLKTNIADPPNECEIEIIRTAMNETNSCYHLFQHSLASYLTLIGILNFAASKILARSDDDTGNSTHLITAVSVLGRKVRKSLIYRWNTHLLRLSLSLITTTIRQVILYHSSFALCPNGHRQHVLAIL